MTGRLWGLWGHRGGAWPDVGVREGFLAEMTAACSPSLASGTQLTPWPWSQPPDPWKQAAPISAGTWDGGDSGGGRQVQVPQGPPFSPSRTPPSEAPASHQAAPPTGTPGPALAGMRTYTWSACRTGRPHACRRGAGSPCCCCRRRGCSGAGETRTP